MNSKQTMRSRLSELREKITFLSVGKAFAILAACCNLIFYPIHVDGMLKMTNDLCGITMFLFVLLGLVTLFQATRTQAGKKGLVGVVLELAALIATVAAGITLYGMYGDAIATQVGITQESILLIQKAMRYSVALFVAYGLAGACFIVHLIRGVAAHDGKKA